MATPLILNRYRLLETTGKGGFGTVDVAWDSRLQRRVAIKRIPLAIDATDLPGIQEARTAALLNDAHIVNVLDFEVTGTEALLIMEYVDGPTLGSLLRESPELLDLDLIATVFTDVASALEYAHENQVLHLDIKPDNILIDHKGHIKVSEFGHTEHSDTYRFAEPQGGTLGYMPPEQLMQGEVDARTDLWALASLLYQLLTGTNPFFAQTADESLERILDNPLPLPSALRPELDGAFDDVLVTALMADKERRFGRVADFVAEAKPLLGSPQTGRRHLKRRINERDLDEVELSDNWHQEDPSNTGEDVRDEDGEDDATASPLWERLPSRLQGLLSRMVAAVACAVFAFVGLSGFDLLVGQAALIQPDAQLIAFVGVIALVSLGAFLVPQLGSILACLALVAGVFARGSYVVGAALALILLAWWLLFGRKGPAESNTVMLTPFFGALGLGFALPLLAGYFLPWRRALAAALAQGLVLTALVALTGSESVVHTGLTLLSHEALAPQEGWFIPIQTLAYLGQPLCWVTLAALLLAALVMALPAARGTGASRLLGLVLGCVVLALSCVVAPFLFESALKAGDIVSSGVSLALSFILVLIVTLLGVPAGTFDDGSSEED
jgi:serine/threonine protein kinase